MGHHFCENILEYMQVVGDPQKIKLIQADIEDIMVNQTQYDKQAQQQMENDLKMQLGLLGGDKTGMLGANGLQIIQDDNDEN